MSTIPGELRLFASPLPPGWLACDGSPLAISQYTPLFKAIGTIYGGDGVNNFNLPDLRGAVLAGAGAGYSLGGKGGLAAVALEVPQIPSHTHNAICATTAGQQASPVNGFWAVTSSGEVQYAPTGAAPMAADALQAAGAHEGHPNMQPYLALTYAIATGA